MLLEALVAVLIIAAMAGVWFETLGSGVRGQQALADRRLALLVAQSRLATAGVLTNGPGDLRGSDSEFDWRLSERPYRDGGAGINAVTVTVSRGRPDGDGPVLATLHSLRVAR